MVVFEDGLPRKAEYRRFTIRGEDGTDDTAAIARGDHPPLPPLPGGPRGQPPGRGRRERPRTPTTPRRGRRKRFAYPPNLIVVDGGPPQVAAAARALTELGVDDVALCGLAKRLEEVWLPDEDAPVMLGRSSEGLYLLQRVRDEAHRFAITHHRQRRSKAMTASELDGVPGLGPARKRALLRHFGSVARLRDADLAQIASVPGIGPGVAASVAAALGAGAPGAGSRGKRSTRQRENSLTDDPTGTDHRELLVITGMSGAGRSTAGKVLEDLGWYVVDNLPPALISSLVDLVSGSGPEVAHLAVAVDVRGRSFFSALNQSLAELHRRGIGHRLLFLDASDEALVRRFESVRRPHPLQGDGRLLDGIQRERSLLEELRGRADMVIDTSRPQRAPAVGEGGPGLRGRRWPRLPADGDVLRLQVRAAAGRRPRGRRALPAEPVLDPRAASPDRAGRLGERLRAGSGRGAQRSCDRYVEDRSNRCSPGTCGRTSATPPSRSAAPAASTARWR